MIDNTEKKEAIEQILQHSDDIFREWLPKIPIGILDLNLTMPQFKIVLLLFLEGSPRMSNIASGLGVSLATATGVIDRLVEHGCVVREAQPQDRRVVLCHLSDEGNKLVTNIWKASRQNIEEILLTVEADKLRQFDDILTIILETARTAKVNIKNGQLIKEPVITQDR